MRSLRKLLTRQPAQLRLLALHLAIPKIWMTRFQRILVVKSNILYVKCSEEISLEFTKPTIFLPCKHVVHYDCIKDSRKMCPTCPLSGDLKIQGLNTAQKKT